MNFAGKSKRGSLGELFQQSTAVQRVVHIFYVFLTVNYNWAYCGEGGYFATHTQKKVQRNTLLQFSESHIREE